MNRFDQMWYEYQDRQDRLSNFGAMVLICVACCSAIAVGNAVMGWLL